MATPAENLRDPYESLLDSLSSNPTSSFKDYRDVSNFAQGQGFTVTSTTGGTHNRGSAHYQGRAVDVRSRDKSDDEIQSLMANARSQGLIVHDERQRPEGQAVWGGPHIHLEVAQHGRSQQQDPYESLLGDIEKQAKAQPTPQPQDDYDKLLDTLSSPAPTPPSQGEAVGAAPTLPSRGITNSPTTFSGIRSGARGEDTSTQLPNRQREPQPIQPTNEFGRLNIRRNAPLPHRGRLQVSNPDVDLSTLPQVDASGQTLPSQQEQTAQTARMLGAAVTGQASNSLPVQPGSNIGGVGNRVFIKPTAQEQGEAVSNRQAEQARIESQLTPEDRAEIQRRAASGASDSWGTRAVVDPILTSIGVGGEEALAGIFQTVEDLANKTPLARLQRPGENPNAQSDELKKDAYMTRMAVEQANQTHPMSGLQTALSSGGELLGNVALMAAANELGGPNAAFSGLSASQAVGRGEGYGEAGFEAIKGRAYKNLFGAAENLPLAKRGAAMFAGTYGIEKATGASDEQALKAAATNAGFVTIPEAVGRTAEFVKSPQGYIQRGIDAKLRSDQPTESVPYAPGRGVSPTASSGGRSMEEGGANVEGVQPETEAPPQKQSHELQPRRKINVPSGTKGQFRKETVSEREARRAQVAQSVEPEQPVSQPTPEAERTPETDFQYFRTALADKGINLVKAPRSAYEFQAPMQDSIRVNSHAEMTAKAKELLIREGLIDETAGRRESDRGGLEGQTVEAGQARQGTPGKAGGVSPEIAEGAGEGGTFIHKGDLTVADLERYKRNYPQLGTNTDDNVKMVGGMLMREVQAHPSADEFWDAVKGTGKYDSSQSFWSRLGYANKDNPDVSARYIRSVLPDTVGKWLNESVLFKRGKNLDYKAFYDQFKGGTPVKGEEGAQTKDVSPSLINQWQDILRKDPKGGVERLRSYLMSRVLARPFGGSSEEYLKREGLTEFYDWAKPITRGEKSAEESVAPPQVQERAKVEKPPTRYQQTGIRRKPSFDPETHDLSRFVISEGGIRVDRDKTNAGEVNRLQKLRPGLINNKSGKTVEEMAQRAAEAGFAVGEGGGYVDTSTGAGRFNAGANSVDPDLFRDKLEEDASGLKKHYTSQAEISRDELDGFSPSEREEYDREMSFLSDPRVKQSLGEVKGGKEDAGIRDELYTLAANYRLTDDTVDEHLEYARQSGPQREGASEISPAENQGQANRPTLESLRPAEQPSMLPESGGLFTGEAERAPRVRGRHPADAQREQLLSREAEKKTEKLRQTFGDATSALQELSRVSDGPVRKAASDLISQVGTIRQGVARDKAMALAKFADLRSKGQSLSDYEQQGSMFGEQLSPEQMKHLREMSRSVGREGESGKIDLSFLSPVAQRLRKALGIKEPEPIEPSFRLRGKRENEPSIRDRQRGAVPESSSERVSGTAREGFARRASEAVAAPEVGAQDSRQVGTERASGERPVRRAAVSASEAAKQERVEPESAPVTRARSNTLSAEEPGRIKERSLPKTLESAELPQGTDLTYEEKTNVRSGNAARDRIQRMGERGATDWVLAGEKPSVEQSATAVELIKTFANSGDAAKLERAVTIADEMSRKATEAGQFNQYFATLARESPEGAVMAAQRAVTRRGGKLTSEEAQDFVDTATRLQKAEAKIAEHEDLEAKVSDLERQLEEMRAESSANKDVEKVINDERAQVRRVRRAQTKQQLDTEYADLKAQFARAKAKVKNTQPSGLAGLDPEGELSSLILKMAQNRVRSGVNTVKGLVDEVYNDLKEHVDELGLSKRDVRDAISGYGKTAEMSKEPDAVKLRELKRQMRLVSALEDAQSGQRPLRSGLQRDAQSETVKDLQRQVTQVMKEKGIRQPRRASEQKDSLDALKTRLRNEIGSLDRGEVRTKSKPVVRDAEADALKAERDLLKRRLENPTEKNKERLQARIAETERQLREKDFERKGYPSKIYDDAQTTVLRGRLKELNKQKPTPLIKEIVARAKGDATLYAGASKIASRPDITSRVWANEMASEFGLTDRDLGKAFRDSYQLYKDAKVGLRGGQRQVRMDISAARADLQRKFRDVSRTRGQRALAKTGQGLSTLNRNALLTVRGAARILGGMTGKQAADTVGDMIAAPMDAMLSKVRGTPRGTARLTVPGLTRASIHGATEGAQNALLALRGKETQFSHAEEPLTGLKPVDASVNSMQRIYSAKENFIRSYAYNKSIETQARTYALNDLKEGKITRGEVDARTKEYLTEGKMPVDSVLNALVMAERATTQANYDTNMHRLDGLTTPAREAKFKTDLDALMNSVAMRESDEQVYAEPSEIATRVRRAVGALGVPGKVVEQGYMPFMRRPSNALVDFFQTYVGAPLNVPAQGIRMILDGKSPEAQVRFSKSVGRGLVGYSLLDLGGVLRATGHMTGMYYKDEDKRGCLIIDGHYFPVWKVPFVGWLLTLGATVDESGISSAPGAMGKMIIEHPFLRGIREMGTTVENLGNAVKGGDKMGEALSKEAVRTGGQFASRLVPQPLPTIAEGTDTKERVTNENIYQPTLSRIPWARQTLTPFADKSKASIVDPFYSAPRQPPSSFRSMFGRQSEGFTELQRLGVQLKGVQPRRGESQTDYLQRKAETNPAIGKAIDETVRDPAYKRATDEEKRKAIREAVESVTRANR